MSAGADLMPNPPLLGASRDEIARIVRERIYRSEFDYPLESDWLHQTLVVADAILALPAFAGLLTPSLSHEEEDHTVSRNSGTTCRGAEPAAPANASVLVPPDAGTCEGDDSGWVLAFLHGLHAHLPEDERPTSWMQFSDAQRERIKAAYRAMVDASPGPSA